MKVFGEDFYLFSTKVPYKSTTIYLIEVDVRPNTSYTLKTDWGGYFRGRRYNTFPNNEGYWETSKTNVKERKSGWTVGVPDTVWRFASDRFDLQLISDGIDYTQTLSW